MRRFTEVLRLLPLAFCTWLGCHALAGLDSLTVGEEDESSDVSTGRGGSGGTPSATSVGGLGGSSSVSIGGMTSATGTGGGIVTNDCCIAHPGTGCSGAMATSATASSSSGMQMMCEYCVCMQMSTCCSTEWTQACANLANTNCQSPCGC